MTFDFSVFQSYGDFPSGTPGLRLSPCRYGSQSSRGLLSWGKPCVPHSGLQGITSLKEWREVEKYRTLCTLTTNLHFQFQKECPPGAVLVHANPSIEILLGIQSKPTHCPLPFLETWASSRDEKETFKNVKIKKENSCQGNYTCCNVREMPPLPGVFCYLGVFMPAAI